jgi:hypothetical protein
MERLFGWTLKRIEAHIGDNRVAKCKPDTVKMARAIILGNCDFEAVVSLFGGTPSSNKRVHGASSSVAGTGRAGTFLGLSAAVDVPKAFEAFGTLLRCVQGKALGGKLSIERDFGFKALVDEGFESVDVARVRFMIEEIFKRLNLWCERRRQRVGYGAPDIGAMVTEMRTESLTALTNEQASADVSLKVALAAIAGWGNGGAGAKERATAAAMLAATGGEPEPATAAGKPAAPDDGLSANQRKRARAKLKKKEAADAKSAGTGGQTPQDQNPQPKTQPKQTQQPQQPQQGQPPQQPQPQPQAGHQQPKIARAVTTPVPTFASGSITKFVDSYTREGAVEAFDYLSMMAYPSVAGELRPCAFECMATCAKAASGLCYKCKARSALTTTPVTAPAGAVAKVKAACDAVTAAKITRG